MAASVQVLDGRIVGVLVGDEEGTADLAAVGVHSVSVEDLVIEIDVVDVDGSVEGDGDHLGHLLGLKTSRDTRAVSRAVAVRQHALGRVAVGCTIRVSFHG